MPALCKKSIKCKIIFFSFGIAMRNKTDPTLLSRIRKANNVEAKLKCVENWNHTFFNGLTNNYQKLPDKYLSQTDDALRDFFFENTLHSQWHSRHPEKANSVRYPRILESNQFIERASNLLDQMQYSPFQRFLRNATLAISALVGGLIFGASGAILGSILGSFIGPWGALILGAGTMFAGAALGVYLGKILAEKLIDFTSSISNTKEIEPCSRDFRNKAKTLLENDKPFLFLEIIKLFLIEANQALENSELESDELGSPATAGLTP
jgi:hypothetical protein